MSSALISLPSQYARFWIKILEVDKGLTIKTQYAPLQSKHLQIKNIFVKFALLSYECYWLSIHWISSMPQYQYNSIMNCDYDKAKSDKCDDRGFRSEINTCGNMAGKPTFGPSIYSERGYIRVYEEGLEIVRSKHIYDSPRTRRDEESQRLVEIAKASGDYILYSDVLKFGVRVPQGSGESEVFVNELSSLVYKVKNPYSKAALKPNVQPEDAILEHLVHNKYFPETSYHFEGITEDMGEVRIILSQKFRISYGRPSKEEVEKDLATRGLLPCKKYFYGNSEISVTDVSGDNSLMGDDGKIYFIDPLIDFKLPIYDILRS